jgi:anti-sigma regulatory factor (Ser/Thr protein kinase)
MVQMRREFSSDLRHLAEMRALAREACRQAWGPDAEEGAVAALELALGEAAANVVLHAYGREPDRPVEMVIEADDRAVSVTLYHRGRGFDPDAAAPPVLDGRQESGYGLYLIRQSVDRVDYFQDDEGRNGVRLVKYRPGTESSRGA